MRKKSSAVSLADFRTEVACTLKMINEFQQLNASPNALTEAYDHALVLLYNAFEDFVLSICIGCVNRDPAPLYESAGVNFGKHLTAEQAAYLITGGEYFAMGAFDGLVKKISRIAGKKSQLIPACKTHKNAIAILIALRNYAAHGSYHARGKALAAMQTWEKDRKNLGRAGSWLKVSMEGKSRLDRLISELDAFAVAFSHAAQPVTAPLLPPT